MENQQLQKWALIAEIIGGLAILATLVILVFEINASTQAMRAQTAQEIWNQLSQALISGKTRETVNRSYEA